jgi:hypothetical protein
MAEGSSHGFPDFIVEARAPDERDGPLMAALLRELVSELGERVLKKYYRTVWTFVHERDQNFKKAALRRRAGSSRNTRERASTPALILKPLRALCATSSTRA